MRLIAVDPSVAVEDLLSASGFELLVADDVGRTTPPTEQQPRIVREPDPAGLIVGR